MRFKSSQSLKGVRHDAAYTDRYTIDRHSACRCNLRGCSEKSLELVVSWTTSREIHLGTSTAGTTTRLPPASITAFKHAKKASALSFLAGAIVEGAEDDPREVAGFHVLQVYGDHVRDFCQLCQIEGGHSWDPRHLFDFGTELRLKETPFS